MSYLFFLRVQYSMKKKWQINKIYKVVGFESTADEKVLRRLLEFGFTKGTNFLISHKTLLGETVIVEIRGFSLSLRTKFLSCLKVAE